MNIELVKLQTYTDGRGELSVGELGKELPFLVKRIYYIYNVPSKDIRRGYHSHKKLHQFFICPSGSCKLLLDDGKEKCVIELSKPNYGLYIGPGIWREMFDFSKDAILVVLASEEYDEEDYIRDYDTFIKSESD